MLNGPQLSPVKRAYLAMRELEERLRQAESRNREPLAIVGLACRFPGRSDTPAAFWSLLENGGDAVGELNRWDMDAFYDPDPAARGKMSTRYGALLERVDLFDPQFFEIAPREAHRMDPQQRLLLEVAWEALEDAGHAALIALSLALRRVPRDLQQRLRAACDSVGRLVPHRLPTTPPAWRTASPPAACPTCSGCKDPASPSTPPVPLRWLPPTSPA